MSRSIIRQIEQREQDELKKMHGVVFGFPYDPEKDESRFYPGEAWACFGESGKIEAGMCNHVYEIYFDGHAVGMGGIGGVATYPEARRLGAIRRVFDRVFEDSLEQGMVFSVLYPFSHHYYRMFGYEGVYRRAEITIPMDYLSHIPRNNSAYLVSEGADRGELYFVYDRFAASRNLAVRRGERQWEGKVSDQPWKTKKQTYVYRNQAGEARGLATVELAGGFGATDLSVHEFLWLDFEALRDMLGFLRHFDARAKVNFHNLPADCPIEYFFVNHNKIERRENRHAMARVLNVKKALELMRYPESGGRFSIKVTGDCIVKNNGVYTVEFSNSCAEDKKADTGDADMEAGIPALSHLMLGTQALANPTSSLLPGLIVNANRQTLERIFVKKLMYLGDFF